MQTISLTVNGKTQSLETDPQRPLLEVLREDLALTGAKYGCGEGQCRACTVLMDGRPVISCLTPVSAATGKSITTIEGLADGDQLHPVQQSLMEEGMQCGYCASGMILTAAALLDQNPEPTDEQIHQAMNGNICRCCGYSATLRAIRRAAGRPAEDEQMLHIVNGAPD